MIVTGLGQGDYFLEKICCRYDAGLTCQIRKQRKRNLEYQGSLHVAGVFYPKEWKRPETELQILNNQ
jgi:hypothetical protein